MSLSASMHNLSTNNSLQGSMNSGKNLSASMHGMNVKDTNRLDPDSARPSSKLDTRSMSRQSQLRAPSQLGSRMGSRMGSQMGSRMGSRMGSNMISRMESRLGTSMGSHLAEEKRREHERIQAEKEEQARRELLLSGVIKKELEMLFKSFDLTGLGGLTREDLKCAYKTFGIDVDSEECEEIIQQMDTTGEGKITFPDFEREMQELMLHRSQEEHQKLVFKAFDEDNSGYFGADELSTQFQKLGALITPDEAVEEFKRIGEEGAGFVNFSQFKSFVDEMEEPHVDNAAKKNAAKGGRRRRTSRLPNLSSSINLRSSMQSSMGGRQSSMGGMLSGRQSSMKGGLLSGRQSSIGRQSQNSGRQSSMGGRQVEA